MSMTGAPERMVVVTKNYPSVRDPHVGTFVHSLAGQFAQAGVDVTVIAPRRFFRSTADRTGIPASGEDENGRPRVLRPAFWPFSNKVLPGGFSTFRWTSASFSRTVAREALDIEPPPSLVYAHFLFPAGRASLELARRWGVPAVVALGEGSLRYYERHLDAALIRETVHQFAGIICVSQENRDYCVERLGVPDERITLLPNAADTTRVYPRDRESMRYKFGLPAERPIVVFVGHFQNDKGPQRVMDAISHLPEVGAVFLGSGSQTPDGSQVLFAGKVPHAEIPEWLSAADLFILPTLVEASSNAIGEAMACGLPIVSSDIPSVRAMVGDAAATLVDPTDEAVLGRAIEDLLGSPERRRQMSASGLERARSYTLQHRADLILDWLAGIASQKAEAAR